MNNNKALRHIIFTRNMRRIILLIFVITFTHVACAEEHPTEHSRKATEEHPKKEEHPKGETTPLTKEDLATAIEEYVKKDANQRGGYFLVYDDKAKKPLVLSLEKVHKERLATIGTNVYFACADFKTPEGKIYDLDIFVKGVDKHHLEVTQITIHKESGKARYTWYEEKGVWKKKPTG